MADGFNAWLSDSTGQYNIGLKVIKVNTGFIATYNQGVLNKARVMYPRHMQQQDITVDCVTRNEEERNQIRYKMGRLMGDAADAFGNVPKLAFTLPSQGWCYEVYIKKLPLGLERFEVGPVLSFTLVIARDKLDNSPLSVSYLNHVYWWDDPNFNPIGSLNDKIAAADLAKARQAQDAFAFDQQQADKQRQAMRAAAQAGGGGYAEYSGLLGSSNKNENPLRYLKPIINH